MHPVLFQIGPVALYSYGFSIAVGFLLATALVARRAKALGQDPGRLQKVALTALLCGLAGGRVVYILLNWEVYRANLLEILRLDHGGLVFYGGLAGGILGGLLAARSAGLPMLRTVDFFMPPLALAHAIGRVGCFFNGCCYGRPTALPWGVLFPGDILYRHPTQLYEATALAVLFLYLKRLERRSPPPGAILSAYGLLYGSWRFFVEFLRGDSPRLLMGLTPFQLASLPLALFFGWMLLRTGRK